MLTRTLQPEILDGLAPEDPRARRARRDLRRVNRLMGSCATLLRALRLHAPRRAEHPRLTRARRPLQILELGAGDGSLMLRIARALASSWPQVQLQLLDRQALLDAATTRAFAELGWSVQALALDVRAWASAAAHRKRGADIIVANLFLHHFSEHELRSVLAAVAAQCTLFIAYEPRRAPAALLGSHLLGAIGASALTRHDAALSVRAGFRAGELSALWPAHEPHWQLHERAAGAFGHFFSASKHANSASHAH